MKRRICPECGKIVSEYTFFCMDCGSKTVEDDGPVKAGKSEEEPNIQQSERYVEKEEMIV